MIIRRFWVDDFPLPQVGYVNSLEELTANVSKERPSPQNPPKPLTTYPHFKVRNFFCCIIGTGFFFHNVISYLLVDCFQIIHFLLPLGQKCLPKGSISVKHNKIEASRKKWYTRSRQTLRSVSKLNYLHCFRSCWHSSGRASACFRCAWIMRFFSSLKDLGQYLGMLRPQVGEHPLLGHTFMDHNGWLWVLHRPAVQTNTYININICIYVACKNKAVVITQQGSTKHGLGGKMITTGRVLPWGDNIGIQWLKIFTIITNRTTQFEIIKLAA